MRVQSARLFVKGGTLEIRITSSSPNRRCFLTRLTSPRRDDKSYSNVANVLALRSSWGFCVFGGYLPFSRSPVAVARNTLTAIQKGRTRWTC